MKTRKSRKSRQEPVQAIIEQFDNLRINSNSSNASTEQEIIETFIQEIQLKVQQETMTIPATTLKQPRYQKGMSPEVFFKIYEKTATVNQWSDQVKMDMIYGSFKGQLLEWFVSRTFTSFKEMKAAFLNYKGVKKSKDDVDYLNQLLEIKRIKYNNLDKYINKFENAKNRREQFYQDNGGSSDAENAEKLDFYIKVFIKHCSPSEMRRELKGNKEIKTMEDAFSAARDFEDDFTDEEESSESEEDDDSDDDSDDSEDDRSQRRHYKKKSVKKGSKKNIDLQAAFLGMIEQNKALLAQHQVTMQQQQGANNSQIRKLCYNCNSDAHLDRYCTLPCKHCGSSEHKRFFCPVKPKKVNFVTENNNTNTITQINPSSSSQYIITVPDDLCALLSETSLEENGDDSNDLDVLVAKRIMDEDEEENTRSKKARKIAHLQEELKKKEQERLSMEARKTKVQEKKKITQERQSEAAGSVIKNIKSQKVFSLSLDDLSAISPKLFSNLKRTIKEDADNFSGLLVDHDIVLPEGNGAPWLQGSINGKNAEIIKDTGSTASIISLDWVKHLYLEKKLIKSPLIKRGMSIADDRTIYPVGILENALVEISPGVARKLDALCLDVKTYDFILGRICMAYLRVGTFLDESQWFVRQGDKIINLVTYHTNKADQCYMIMLSPLANDVAPDNNTSVQEEDEHMLDVLINNILENPNLTEHMKTKLVSLVKNKREAFGTHYRHLTQTNLLQLHINTGDAKPIMCRLYQEMSLSEQEHLQKELQDMVNNGIIVPSMHDDSKNGDQGWSFPVMYVPKKNGEKRLVSMFQDLNKVTVKNTWPLPHITYMLEAFQEASWYTSLDLLKGFNQIPVHEDSVSKLTITTIFGNYSYVCMPMGIINGPATFSRAIHLVLQQFIPSFCMAYIDDALVFSKTAEDHLMHLEKILDRIIEVKMKINPNKVSLF